MENSSLPSSGREAGLFLKENPGGPFKIIEGLLENLLMDAAKPDNFRFPFPDGRRFVAPSEPGLFVPDTWRFLSRSLAR